MIAINATLGTGLYWRSGEILHQAGLLAVAISYSLVGLVAWSVMQCIGELLCIWPIPGAVYIFVGEFVNPDLGTVVGIMFAWTVGCTSLVATMAAEATFWNVKPCLVEFILTLVTPAILGGLNSFSTQRYGRVESFTGTVKLLMLLFALVLLVMFTAGFWSQWNKVPDIETSGVNIVVAGLYVFIKHDVVIDSDESSLSLSTAAFAYVGIEVVTASALEARWTSDQGGSHERLKGNLCSRPLHMLSSLAGRLLPRRLREHHLLRRPKTEGSSSSDTVKLAATRVPVIITVSYVLSGIFLSGNIGQDDPRLPSKTLTNTNSTQTSAMVSPFVAIIQDCPDGSGTPWANAINAILIFTAFTCAMTSLYIASRSLFAVLVRVSGSEREYKWRRCVASFGTTNKSRVPLRALLVSLTFVYISLLYPLVTSGKCATGSEELQTGPSFQFYHAFATASAVAVVLVWTFESAAFLRFYYWQHQATQNRS
ncbi:hypothetical protein GQ53DRAFT_828416 [Thozetella sp. PMI_491]|nr:hypothetical protein GQ53DRAFT_828416 [Thozetella sp. PMI_491]